MAGKERSDSKESDRGKKSYRQQNDLEELDSWSHSAGSKRYYVDVKRNNMGTFLKVVEVQANGYRPKLNLPMSMVANFKDKLAECEEQCKEIDCDGDQPEDDDEKPNVTLFSHLVQGPRRRIHLDVKKNKRGVYLRISMVTMYRNTIAIPASVIPELRKCFDDFYSKYGQSDEDLEGELPQSQSVVAERKLFWFDSGRNDRGYFLRISEVTNNYRSAITIPASGLSDFKDILSDFHEKMKELDIAKPE